MSVCGCASECMRVCMYKEINMKMWTDYKNTYIIYICVFIYIYNQYMYAIKGMSLCIRMD